MKKAKRKRKQPKLLKRKPIISRMLFIIACLLITLGIGIYVNHTEKNRYKLETPKNQVYKLPKEAIRKLATASATIRVPILMYHYVEYVQDKNDTIRQSLNISPFVFDQQVMTLKNAGYTFITAKELGDILDEKKEAPAKPVLLTFDDGHWDLETDILPILKKHHAKATAYVVPGFINQSDFLTMQQLQNVANSGLVEIGAHTVHHMWLKGGLRTDVETEVKESKLQLEKLLHIPVISFAYPYGAFDQQAENAVKEAGFLTAVSTSPGIEASKTNRYFLYRLRPGERMGDTLVSFLNQRTFNQW